MALKDDGTVWEFNTILGGSPGMVMGLSDITAISVGGSVWMALDDSGVMYYIGVAIDQDWFDYNDIVMTSAGGSAGVAIDETNQLYYCIKRFGRFSAEKIDFGQPVITAVAPVAASSSPRGVAYLDDGTIAVYIGDYYIEGTVQGPQDIVAIDMKGDDYVLMLDQGGAVWEWDIDYGTTPQQVTNLSGAVSVSAGGSFYDCFSAAALDEGSLWVWGGVNNLTLQQVIFPG